MSAGGARAASGAGGAAGGAGRKGSKGARQAPMMSGQGMAGAQGGKGSRGAGQSPTQEELQRLAQENSARMMQHGGYRDLPQRANPGLPASGTTGNMGGDLRERMMSRGSFGEGGQTGGKNNRGVPSITPEMIQGLMAGQQGTAMTKPAMMPAQERMVSQAMAKPLRVEEEKQPTLGGNIYGPMMSQW